MFFIGLRVLITVYLVGASLLLYVSLSDLIFSKKKVKGKMKGFLKIVLFIPLWPLSLFSKAGRDKLTKNFKKVN